jgi:hypothetical protein
MCVSVTLPSVRPHLPCFVYVWMCRGVAKLIDYGAMTLLSEIEVKRAQTHYSDTDKGPCRGAFRHGRIFYSGRRPQAYVRWRHVWTCTRDMYTARREAH